MYSKKQIFKFSLALPLSFFVMFASNTMATEEAGGACLELLQACSETVAISTEKASECKDLRFCKKDCGINRRRQ